MVPGTKKDSSSYKMTIAALLVIVLIVASASCTMVHPENSSQPVGFLENTAG